MLCVHVCGMMSVYVCVCVCICDVCVCVWGGGGGGGGLPCEEYRSPEQDTILRLLYLALYLTLHTHLGEG